MPQRQKNVSLRRPGLHSGGSVCLATLGGSCLHSGGSWRPWDPSLAGPRLETEPNQTKPQRNKT